VPRADRFAPPALPLGWQNPLPSGQQPNQQLYNIPIINKTYI
jgi:hypothetical protein